jgi:hypothetical protein
VVSIILTALALFMARETIKPSHESISSLGILQTIWLLHEYPDLCQAVANVEVPTLDNLRAAGMLPVQLDSLRLRHANQRNSSTDEIDDGFPMVLNYPVDR